MKEIIQYQCETCLEKYDSEGKAILCENRHIFAEEKIEKFVNKIKEKYPDIKIKCDYDKEDDEYEILYTDKDLLDYDEKFNDYVAELTDEMFGYGVYNFYIAYDYNAFFSELKKIKIEYNDELTRLIKKSRGEN